ncbi:MAG: CBS domain-containing protein [Saprospiraceae bacterium]|nr:CBS domain-containing protein [Saprospiraceae bacterium]
MNAVNLISYSIPLLKTSTTGQEALDLMSDHYVQHLPIVNNEQLLGLISEDDILENDEKESIGSYQLSSQQSMVKDTDHIFDVMAAMAKAKMTVIPVVDENEKFLGVISQQDLLRYFADGFSFTESGGILVLEMGKADYALSDISRVVEAENVAIICCFISRSPDESKINVHIKISTPEIYRVISALDRYGYQVVAMYTEQPNTDVFKDRYESFIHYLNF